MLYMDSRLRVPLREQRTGGGKKTSKEMSLEPTSVFGRKNDGSEATGVSPAEGRERMFTTGIP